MKAISNALKGVTYHNPQLGESLYELCRRATSRHISGPDEILNQQVVYMINSEMHNPYAAKDACTCLKRRLQMDHPQKQYLAIILTSKVLQECHAAMGIYQGELLQEVAYILRTVRSSGPAAARTRQVAMDVLRHFGSAGGDAYRVARQQGGFVPAPQMGVVPAQNRDPAAVAAERESLLDEIKRMCEQASASTEILNELILSKRESQSASDTDDSAGLRKELLADAKELRKLFDLYMNQLAALTGSDAEDAMKAALEAVDQLDNALTLEKDVDAELKDLEAKGQLPAQLPPPVPAVEAAAEAPAAAPTAAKAQSMNLIDLDDEPPAAAATAPAAAAAPMDPFAPPPPPAAAADPFAPIAATAQGPADPFAAIAAVPAASNAAADPFAALAVASAAPAAAGNHIGAGGYAGQVQPFPPLPTPPASSAVAADPFADAAPSWGTTQAQTSTPAAASSGADAFAAPASTPQQQQQELQPVVSGPASVTSGPTSTGGASFGSGGGVSAGGYMPQQQQPQPAGYGMPGMMAPPGMPGYGVAGVYGMPGQMPGYGMHPYAGMTGQMPGTGYYMPQPTGMPTPGNGLYPSPYSAAQPQTTGGVGGTYGPAGTPGAAAAPYPTMMPQQSSPQSVEPQKPQVQQPIDQPQQQQMPYAQMTPPASAPASAGLSASNPFATVAPAAGSTANPFGAVAAGTTGNVDAEWDKFFKQ